MSENPELRLKMHNFGKVKSTKHYKPFKLVYKESVENREEARKRERYLKSAAGRRFLDENLD